MNVYKPFISPKIIFGNGKISEIKTIIDNEGLGKKIIYFVDHFFNEKNFEDILYLNNTSIVYYVDTSIEPKTDLIDYYVSLIKDSKINDPEVIIGFGGGSVMDVAKAVSILLKNTGNASDYQGWDLVKNEGVYKIGIPTISGTGSEVSRTTVLSGPHKKQGINSLKSMFDYVILDPELLRTVPKQQEFYTAMDCYIHSVEALSGTFINNFSAAFATKGLEICEDLFLDSQKSNYADLMVASMFGGYSIVYSEVGVCHALSYGISICFGIHHGEANCIVFNYLEDYYPEYVRKFKNMLKINNITLKKNLTKNISELDLNKMIDATLLMDKPLTNALGENWRDIFTRDKIKEIYLKM